VSDETRRAPAAFALHDVGGAITAQDTAEAVIGDDDLKVGPVTLAFLDADALRAADYRIELDLWPSGTLALSQLGRRFDTFTAELRRSRSQARVAGLLAHGVAMPTVFPAAVLEQGNARPAECQVYQTHVTIVPTDDDPWQVPLGALTGIETSDDPPAIVLQARDGGRSVVGQLARRRDEFRRAVTEQRDAQAQLLASLTGSAAFADGQGVERARLPGFDALVTRWSAPARAEGAVALLGRARAGEPRLGFVQLLDPDGESLQAASPLPEHWATFLLVPVGPLTVLELLAGPSAATYVFEAPIDAVNRDLQLLHFRRGALALRGKDAELTALNPYRLALRKLAPLQRLRAATRARIVHNEGWSEAVSGALAQT
jgi:hypothetical protein